MPAVTDRLQQLSPELRLYSLQVLPAHLADAGDPERFQHLLTDFGFMQAKLDAFGPEPLIEDYGLLSTGDEYSHEDFESLALIQGALRLSANVIGRDPKQFSSQIVGRLLTYKDIPVIERFRITLPKAPEGGGCGRCNRRFVLPELR